MAKSKTAELLAMFARFWPPAVVRFRSRGHGRGRVQLPRSGVWVIHKLFWSGISWKYELFRFENNSKTVLKHLTNKFEKGKISRKNTPNYHPLPQSTIFQMKVMARNSYVDENPNKKTVWKEPPKIMEITCEINGSLPYRTKFWL